MITYIFTKEQSWLEKWDCFVSNNLRGSHLILSDWLQSYKSYGFDFEIGLVLDKNEIVGGCGVVIPKFLFLKFYIIPHGPIYKDGYIEYLRNHLIKIQQRARETGSCYLQLSMPISSNERIINYTYRKNILSPFTEIFKPGKQFSYVYSSYGINWIDFGDLRNSQSFLEHLTPKVRRNIRLGYNKKAEVSFVKDRDVIKKGYEVIVENARQGNYIVRDFSEFKGALLNLINKNQGYFIIVKVAGVIKASAFFVLNSGYITNITGGVFREKPDIKLGYMLQWEVIKKSFDLNLRGYNISMGGSAGVQEFKSKFGAEPIYFEDSHYHLILKPLHFKLFKFFNKYGKPYKARVSKVLSLIKSWKKL